MLAPDKTRIHRFSRFHPSRRKRFNFLGFEFYWEVDRKGTARLKKRTSRKRLHTSVRAFKEWLKTHRHVPRQQLLAVVRSKLVGYYNYFGMIGNSRSLWTFYRHVEKLLYKWLNRRSQRRSLTRGKLCSVLKYFRIPEPRITERTGVLNPVLA
jgi:hypothetical protein